MPPGFHIATDDGLISVQVRDQIDLVDLYELTKAVLADEDYDPALPLVVDLRGMRLTLERDALEPFSKFVTDRFKGRQGSMAVVIDGDMSRKLAAAIYWLACAVGGSEVFDDYDHAMKWLMRKEFVGSEGPTIVQLDEHRDAPSAC